MFICFENSLKIQKAWLRRFKEVVKPNGIAVIYTKESKFDMKFLCHALKE